MNQPTLAETNRLFQLQSEMVAEDALLLSRALRLEPGAINDFAIRAALDLETWYPRSEALDILTELLEPELEVHRQEALATINS